MFFCENYHILLLDWGCLGFLVSFFHLYAAGFLFSDCRQTIYTLLLILASTGLGLIFGATIIYVFIGRIGKFINGGMQQYREGDMVVVLRGTHKSTTSRISRLLEDRNQVVIEFETKGKIETETFFDFQVLRIK